jgi:hypothetical protein
MFWSVYANLVAVRGVVRRAVSKPEGTPGVWMAYPRHRLL